MATSASWITVYRHGVPVAFIDWDAAQPVDPLADLAAPAWTFVPLAPPAQLSEAGFDPLPDLPARLRTFLDADRLTERMAISPGLLRCKLDEPEPLRWLRGISPVGIGLPRGLAEVHLGFRAFDLDDGPVTLTVVADDEKVLAAPAGLARLRARYRLR